MYAQEAVGRVVDSYGANKKVFIEGQFVQPNNFCSIKHPYRPAMFEPQGTPVLHKSNFPEFWEWNDKARCYYGFHDRSGKKLSG